tara:strand:+ start:3138 stop:3485 length:348 start_codon:yes stop_codon:yes gene_type:complete
MNATPEFPHERYQATNDAMDALSERFNRQGDRPMFVGEGPTPQNSVMVQINFEHSGIGITLKNVWIPEAAMPFAPWIIRGLLFRCGYHMENISGLWAEILNTGSSPEDSEIYMDI